MGGLIIRAVSVLGAYGAPGFGNSPLSSVLLEYTLLGVGGACCYPGRQEEPTS